ncbi:MAG: DUF72 domain-containing protein [Candidatus Omnitrophica bacterium]|nr:DUF72 domain-containing protein [Candidatus Omnitrophota bacterium]
MTQFFVGTSGWNYPHWADGVFYPVGLSKKKWFKYYTEHFNGVELNVTFYRLLRKATFENWYLQTPEKFVFIVKGWRFITHIQRLKKVKETLSIFVENVCGLKNKLGAILWQFPPSFKKDTVCLKKFLKMLTETKTRQVFEFRNQTWFDEEIYTLLEEHNGCLCIAHSGNRYPCKKIVTADFLYLRFHGAGQLYNSDYSDKELKEWANFALSSNVKTVFAFFNNDAYGYAVKNAQKFDHLLRETYI